MSVMRLMLLVLILLKNKKLCLAKVFNYGSKLCLAKVFNYGSKLCLAKVFNYTNVYTYLNKSSLVF